MFTNWNNVVRDSTLHITLSRIYTGTIPILICIQCGGQQHILWTLMDIGGEESTWKRSRTNLQYGHLRGKWQYYFNVVVYAMFLLADKSLCPVNWYYDVGTLVWIRTVVTFHLSICISQFHGIMVLNFSFHHSPYNSISFHFIPFLLSHTYFISIHIFIPYSSFLGVWYPILCYSTFHVSRESPSFTGYCWFWCWVRTAK